MVLFPHAHSRNLKQFFQFGLVLLCIVCIFPTRLFWKSRKWRFPALVSGSDRDSAFVNNNNNNNHHINSSPINTTAECDYFPEALSQFTNALHDRAESTALRDWSLSNKGHRNYPAWQFPGLSGPLLEKTLRGKTVVLLGDSTLFFMMRWIQTLLYNTTQATLDHLLRMDMTAGNHAVNPNGEDQLGWLDETAPEVQLEDGTHFVWIGHRGGDLTGDEVCQFDDIWARIRQLQPDILVVNFGLHWLHLIADQGHGRSVPLCAVQYWLRYEQDWLHQVTQVAMKGRVKLLLFKTTNYMCIDNFGGDYSDAASLYQRQDAYTINRCERELQRKRDYYHNSPGMMSSLEGLEDANLTRYCAKGVLDEYGAKDLNHRLFEFVHEYNMKNNNQQKSTGHDLQIAIFNDHDTQSCPYSEPDDGRHYHPLNLMRIRLLANMIQCLYPTS
jgi:hypothetical protein